MKPRSVAAPSGQVLAFLLLAVGCGSPEPGGGSAPPASESAAPLPNADASAPGNAPPTPAPTSTASPPSSGPPPHTVLPNPEPMGLPEHLALRPLGVERQYKSSRFDGPSLHIPYVSEDGSTVAWVEGRGGDDGSWLIIRTLDDPAKDLSLPMTGGLCGRVSDAACERLVQQSEKRINKVLGRHRWRQFREYSPTIHEWIDKCHVMWHVEFSIPPYKFEFDTPRLIILGIAVVEVPHRWRCPEGDKPYIDRIGIAEKQRVMFIQADACLKSGCESDPYFEFIRLPR